MIMQDRLILFLLFFLTPGFVLAADVDLQITRDFTTSWQGILSLLIFFITYSLIILEESLHLRKSKPAMVAAGIIWVLVAITYAGVGDTVTVDAVLRHNLSEFANLFLFLLAAMTYVNTMEERGVFNLLRAWMMSRGYTLRKIFWLTGLIAFFISPVVDNLTTALLMAVVVSTIGGNNHQFVAISCINIVVAANAGGVFSPFGDVTTLMVWQKGLVDFQEFFYLFVPGLVNWLVTAAFLSFAIARGNPEGVQSQAELKYGAWIVVGLFLITITMAVTFHHFLHLPPVLGMMTGLGILKLFGYYLQRRDEAYARMAEVTATGESGLLLEPSPTYDIYKNLQNVEWDTLMFFYGIILCVGGLGAFGYLALTSEFTFEFLGPTTANILIGFASAVVDNIPIMFAVLEMNPDMSLGQWLLVTLTAGVGGSMLSIGSAAGVAVMGQCRGVYTFMAHLRWTWAVVLGYAASICTHLLLNAKTFT
ncbi:MAG: Citrate transporter [Gammaproteobacteria bacterium]|nr:Citrate transporter [Gammaproteobacteria bacterium]